MEKIMDAFGEEVEIGDQVIFSIDERYQGVPRKGKHGVLQKGKITKTMGKTVCIDDKYTIHQKCFVRDTNHYLSLRDRFLRCLEMCGIGDWAYYKNAENLYEASFKV